MLLGFNTENEIKAKAAMLVGQSGKEVRNV